MEVKTIMDELNDLGADDIVQEESNGREFGKKHQEVRATFLSGTPSSKVADIEATSDWDLYKESEEEVIFTREVSI